MRAAQLFADLLERLFDDVPRGDGQNERRKRAKERGSVQPKPRAEQRHEQLLDREAAKIKSVGKIAVCKPGGKHGGFAECEGKDEIRQNEIQHDLAFDQR